MTATSGVNLRRAAAAAVLALLWLLATSWARPLLLPDEVRYVGVAWEMLRSGDWLTPTLNGLPYFHKPPLFYWITAAAMWLFGANAWAARAAPLLGACLAATALFVFAQRWATPRTAGLALLVLLAQPLIYVGGQFANLDMLVAGCISATILLLAHAALAAEAGHATPGALIAAYAMAALGLLAKGLIGVVLPALVIGSWLVLRWRWSCLAGLWSWWGVLVFLVLAAPWFMAMQALYPDFANYFFIVQHFKRFAGGGFNNVQPFWFYPIVLAALSLPWLPWLGRVLARLRLPQPGPGQAAIRGLMLVWVAVVVVFFSLPRSKLLGYVLPVVPALAYLLADAWAAVDPAQSRQRLGWWASAAVSALVGIAAVVWLAIHPVRSTRELALALGAQHAPGEPVYLLNDYYFDVPFYARLSAPIKVVDDWANPEVARRDNWRKEMADAGQFAVERARTLLITPAQWPAVLCQSPVSWLIGTSSMAGLDPLLRAAPAVAVQGKLSLWRVALSDPALSAHLPCPQTPNGEPPHK